MLDFVMISSRILKQKNNKRECVEVYPIFKVARVEDLMIRGGNFYAAWNEKTGLWTTDEFDVFRMIDNAMESYAEELRAENPEQTIKIARMLNADSGSVDKWHKYTQKQMIDIFEPLDSSVTFSDAKVCKEDYVSKKLPYSIGDYDTSSYDELMSTLYDAEERKKLEWAIGSIFAGDSKRIQKFIVLFGDAGSGKSTVLHIIEQLFEGYHSFFSAKVLGSMNNDFALESFKNNPLVAIEHDGDLSRIEDNTRLNSIVSHEYMEINVKFGKKYISKFDSFLFIGTNKPVKITDAKSGIIRRLIDVKPSGRKIIYSRYCELIDQIKFELGGIAKKCLDLYNDLGEDYYNHYIPQEMISATNDFYNFVENYFEEFSNADGTTLKDAWTFYKEYCDYASVPYPYSMRVVRSELKNYFKEFRDQAIVDGAHYRNYYSGFLKDKFDYEQKESVNELLVKNVWLAFEEQKSIFDSDCFLCPAQYASENETPLKKWDLVTTKLKDINTGLLHYVRVPDNHIVIDFDIKDENGNKSFQKNLEAASKWPKTYAELSKSGGGIHLHYIYDGDVTKLKRIYDDDIEVKVFTGNQSLRRRLTKCNNLPIRTISSGLPLKGAEKVVNFETVKNEKAIRTIIKNCLDKKHHGATKPEVDYIYSVLEDAYKSGMVYDVTDLRPKILAFANNSSHQADKCLDLVSNMHFCSDVETAVVERVDDSDKPIAFYDVEVFQNLFVVVWKVQGEDVCYKKINPSISDITEIIGSYRLIGFNCRRYDNHILYGRILGYSNEELYKLSQRIINGSRNSMFLEAYNISYTDVYDFAAKKQSLKKWEIELGIHHQELGLKWDEPVPEELWEKVAEYCVNDVIATEATFNALQSDFVAREILASITGMSVNDTTNKHTTYLIVGNDPHPQDKFVYTDLSEMFPGYSYDAGKSLYRGEEVGEGGYVYSEPGMYQDVALLDIASMHPNSAINLNIFGPYTKNFQELVNARLYIKHGDYDAAGKLFDGKLKPYLTSKDQAKTLAYALKIAINSVYGLTAAKFDNKLRDPRNVDNIVAKRGALFMVDLKHAVQEEGYVVAHIKTDSIKIPNADQKIIDFVMEFGKKYGYTFEHEATYSKLCLVNDAVYIAKDKADGHWTATGTQFQVPYVFKTLFSKEPVVFEDLCETKTVNTALYLDMNEGMPEDEHDYQFVGKAGLFCPMKPGTGGGILLREKDGKYYAATGTKGYRWLEAEIVKELGKENDIDKSYYESLADDAIKDISSYGDYDWFID